MLEEDINNNIKWIRSDDIKDFEVYYEEFNILIKKLIKLN